MTFSIVYKKISIKFEKYRGVRMKNFIRFSEQIIAKDEIKRIWYEGNKVILLDKDGNKHIQECANEDGAGNVWLDLEKELTVRMY